ncbi:hypothetical protein MY9_3105 [Bacillus sp. JS]|nr:hypothetical protein MY9_3105 [Bacillus sp. JS]
MEIFVACFKIKNEAYDISMIDKNKKALQDMQGFWMTRTGFEPVLPP